MILAKLKLKAWKAALKILEYSPKVWRRDAAGNPCVFLTTGWILITAGSWMSLAARYTSPCILITPTSGKVKNRVVRQWSRVFSEYRFSKGEAGVRLFQMAIKSTRRGRYIWDHIDLDERNQSILFKRQVKSLRRRVWDYVWQTLAVLIIFCLIGGIVWLVAALLANSADQGM